MLDSLSQLFQLKEKFQERAPSPDNAKSDPAQWHDLAATNQSIQVKAQAYRSLKENGLPFNDEELARIVETLSVNNLIKLSKDAAQPFSVIVDEKRQPYVLFHGILGKGAFGIVKLALNLTTKEFVAVKVTREENNSEDNLLARMRLLFGKQKRKDRKGLYKHYHFMKFMPGIRLDDFIDYVLAHGKTLSPIQQCKLLIAILSALLEVMKADISHEDLHTGNVLIDPFNWNALVVDFGLSRDISSEADKNTFHKRDLHLLFSNAFELPYLFSHPALREIVATLKSTEQNIIEFLQETLSLLQSLLLIFSDKNPPEGDHIAYFLLTSDKEFQLNLLLGLHSKLEVFSKPLDIKQNEYQQGFIDHFFNKPLEIKQQHCQELFHKTTTFFNLYQDDKILPFNFYEKSIFENPLKTNEYKFFLKMKTYLPTEEEKHHPYAINLNENQLPAKSEKRRKLPLMR